ncbi:hypothetical protein UFOVP495_6 [uncultured Caudovirales phage]|uniref:Uncharacterized protein n=1 Tax=uncultured Caudovirales phage TaxID=2100421 RepID=A0A6J5MK17_9CAUD|nr:hypothetical protein UFOVP495_6 [uncultured Caudovirales phage]
MAKNNNKAETEKSLENIKSKLHDSLTIQENDTIVTRQIKQNILQKVGEENIDLISFVDILDNKITILLSENNDKEKNQKIEDFFYDKTTNPHSRRIFENRMVEVLILPDPNIRRYIDYVLNTRTKN